MENRNLRDEGQGTRRYYIGRTTRLEKRMREHHKDGRGNYHLVFLYFGDIEKPLKKFGATKFMDLSEKDKLCLTDSIMNVRRLMKK